jgi:DNA-binding response OmpR family regulator
MEPKPQLILIVEDEVTIREALTELLAMEGYQVDCAGDGTTAVARVQAGGVDMVLLDIVLPDMSGLALCQQIRALESEVYLPIVILSALFNKAHRHAAFAVGADDYLTKPFDADELLDRVRVWTRTRMRLAASRALLAERHAQGQIAGGSVEADASLLVLGPGEIARMRTVLEESARDLSASLDGLPGVMAHVLNSSSDATEA